jgi:predicted ArsR family transcriptional regulator
MRETALHRLNDPETSIDAANSVKVPKLEQIVFDWLKNQGEVGGTTEEIANALQLSRVTISPRMKPLKDKKLIQESELRRKGISGRYSIVWIVAKKTEEHFAQGKLC